MSKRNCPSNEQALATFIARKAEIDAMLTSIQDASANHFSTNPDDVNWGHASSLGHVTENFKEIAAFLNV